MADQNGRQTQRGAVVPINVARPDRRRAIRQADQYRPAEVTVLRQRRELDLRRAA